MQIHGALSLNPSNASSMHICLPLTKYTSHVSAPSSFRLSSISCLLPLPNGALLTGGADRCVRYWEPSWPERSYIVAGPVWSDDTGIMEHATHKLQVGQEFVQCPCYPSTHSHDAWPLLPQFCRHGSVVSLCVLTHGLTHGGELCGNHTFWAARSAKSFCLGSCVQRCACVCVRLQPQLPLPNCLHHPLAHHTPCASTCVAPRCLPMSTGTAATCMPAYL